MNQIIYKGAKISFSTTGSGNPLVLLHGFLEDSSIWEKIIPALKTKRQIICIDLPGHGKSDGFSDIHDIPEMANVVLKVLESLDIKEFSIAGHSMGGYVSLELVRKFPMIIRSIVLINSTPHADSEERRDNRDRATALVRKNKDAFVKMAISNLFTPENQKNLKAEIQILKKRALKMSSENIIAALQGMKIRTNYMDSLLSFNNQKMIVAGKKDPVLDFVQVKNAAKTSKCEIFELENGHMSFLEDQEELTKIMLFID